MTQLLQRAFGKAAHLPDAKQEEFARLMLAELESERGSPISSPARSRRTSSSGWPARRSRRAGRRQTLDWTSCRRAAVRVSPAARSVARGRFHS